MITDVNSNNCNQDDEAEHMLCPNCFTEYQPLDRYCAECGYAVGHLTPYLPFVNIRFITEFFGKLWHLTDRKGLFWNFLGVPVFVSAFILSPFLALIVAFFFRPGKLFKHTLWIFQKNKTYSDSHNEVILCMNCGNPIQPSQNVCDKCEWSTNSNST